MRRHSPSSVNSSSFPDWLRNEQGTIRKKWKDRLPVALLFPSTYPLAISNLGFQLVYGALSAADWLVCERFVLPSGREPLRSLESGRPLGDFPVVFASISFEQDYQGLIQLLLQGGIPPLASERCSTIRPGDPLVIMGGVALMINPEPLALFADCMVIGEAEGVLPCLLEDLEFLLDRRESSRELFLSTLLTRPGCYIPSLYSFSWDKEGRLLQRSQAHHAPPGIRRVIQSGGGLAAHSALLSPHAELSMYLAELGRGCSRGCRFCAAGFVYRPPRLWQAGAVLTALEERPGQARRVGLLGMEMANREVLDTVSAYLAEQGCSLSFSSLRADRISDQLLNLLATSSLKSVAIAPDGCSERLRRVINKGLSTDDLLSAAFRLVTAGIVHLKLYVMIGLPTESDDDLHEFIELLERMRALILPAGRMRGQVADIMVSVNSFVPKPWTPFQYHGFGGLEVEKARCNDNGTAAVGNLEARIAFLRGKIARMDNVRMKADAPRKIMEQAVLARGDRRLAGVLLAAAKGKNWRQAMGGLGLDSWQYAVRPREREETFCWDHIDHGIDKDFLWQEYCGALEEKRTPSCDPAHCRRCGVCGAKGEGPPSG